MFYKKKLSSLLVPMCLMSMLAGPELSLADTLKKNTVNSFSSRHGVWANATKSDSVGTGSSTYFEVYNNSQYNFRLLGCTGIGEPEQKYIVSGDSYPQIEASEYWMAQGYKTAGGEPLDMPSTETADMEKNRVKNNTGDFKCYYQVNDKDATPSKANSMYLVLRGDNNYAWTEDLTGHALDDVYKQKEETAKSKINWYVEGPMIAGSVGLAGVTGAVYKILTGKITTGAGFNESLVKSIKLSDVNAFSKIGLYLEYIKNPLVPMSFENMLFANQYVNKETIIRQYYDRGAKNVDIAYKDGKYQLEVILKDNTKIFDADYFSRLNADLLKQDKLITKLENLKNIENISRYKYLNEVRNVAKSSGFEGESLKELMGNARKATGGVKMSFSAGEIAAGMGAFVVEFVVVQALTDFIVKWMTPESSQQGAMSVNFSTISWDVPTSSEISSWNAGHSKEEEKIYATTEVEENQDNAKTSKYKLVKLFSLKDRDNASAPLEIDTETLTSPFFRPQGFKNDPYLGMNYSSSTEGRHSAVVRFDFKSSQVSQEINRMNEAMSEVYSSLGAGMDAYTPHLHPAPEYWVSSIKDTHSKNMLYDSGRVSNGSNLNFARNGLVQMCSDQLNGGSAAMFLTPGKEYVLNVSLPNDPSRPDYRKGGGINTEFISLNDSSDTGDSKASSDVRYSKLVTKSDLDNVLKFNKENPDKPMSYFYSHARTEGAQPEVGENIPLTLSLDGKLKGKSQGKMYLADSKSKTTYIPTYMNYSLFSCTQPGDVDPMIDSERKYEILNSGDKAYEKVYFKGLPEGAKVIEDTCKEGLLPNNQCYKVVDYSNVYMQGMYNFSLIGDTGEEGSTNEVSNIMDLSVNILGGL
ncbi:hypothetical protein LA56_853 [Francisella philomiragia]|uniref:hypothetical protein n=2 Tax=Francisella philomiragia TaxID=28110 RepID=UPI0005A58397|nr:hypothetical protein [Francisella philomiragia]AJI54560.1 hypothetical protein LA56_854 [Francisella philomiragia]AJI56042.1 hypothetical protein LA56_853 [Francisella philomiragia]